jgi:regulator of replication initiation timing
MVTKLLDAINLVQSLSTVNQQLRTAYDQVSTHSEALRIDNDSLMMENTQLRDRLSIIEGMAGVADQPPSPSRLAGASAAPVMLTASNAAMIELQELRR